MFYGKKATSNKLNTTSVTSQVPTAGITHPGASASINSPFHLFFHFFFLRKWGKQTNKTTTTKIKPLWEAASPQASLTHQQTPAPSLGKQHFKNCFFLPFLLFHQSPPLLAQFAAGLGLFLSLTKQGRPAGTLWQLPSEGGRDAQAALQQLKCGRDLALAKTKQKKN